jgi:purine-binding chemotaxis protein CheW
MSEQNNNTLLSFRLADEFFAFDAMKVKHILEIAAITTVPNTPDYMKGVINLHGNIISVVDLRLIMGLEETGYTNDSAIVVIGPDEHQDSSLGVIVDMVKEVIETDDHDLKPTVMSNEKSMIRNFLGTFSIDDVFIHVIDIEELVEAAEV